MKVQYLEGLVDYEQGLQIQLELVEQVRQGGEETLLLLEHAPVFTIGRLRDQSSLRAIEALPYPVHETNRGGQATFHGPGQLVGYAIFDLRRRGQDLHKHLREIENMLLLACGSIGVVAQRREGLTGLWSGERKLASIGVGVKRWISMHGFAINVTMASLPAFDAIVPCGLSGVRMTCLCELLRCDITVLDYSSVIEHACRQVFGEHDPVSGIF